MQKLVVNLKMITTQKLITENLRNARGVVEKIYKSNGVKVQENSYDFVMIDCTIHYFNKMMMYR